MKLAKKKLLDSENRNTIEDATLDLSTAFESLLSDTKDNMRYKVSLRSGAICKMEKLLDFSSVDVVKIVKKFYDYRSDIIHGNQDKNDNRYIELEGFKKFETYLGAKLVLKHIIKFLLSHPKYLKNVIEIDEYLLTGKKNGN